MDEMLKPCPFCGANMQRQRSGMFNHPGVAPRLGGTCLLGGYGWAEGHANLWNTRRGEE